MRSPQDEPLYDLEMARCRYPPEVLEIWERQQRKKMERILPFIQGRGKLLDLGCGQCDMLPSFCERISDFAVGVDDSIHRLPEAIKALPVILARGGALPFRDNVFEVVVTSQMLHEVAQFHHLDEMTRTLEEIGRVLNSGGYYIFLDHIDPSDSKVKIHVTKQGLKDLRWFQRSFKPRRIEMQSIGGGEYLISKRDLQDFLTKLWCRGFPIERLEMKETHCCWTEEDARKLLEGHGFLLRNWCEFSKLPTKESGVELIGIEAWETKFLAVAAAKEQ